MQCITRLDADDFALTPWIALVWAKSDHRTSAQIRGTYLGC